MAQQTPYEWYNQQMVNKQERERMTSVEWLFHQLNTRQKPLDNSQINELFAEAKKMEKEQKLRDFVAGQNSMEEGGKDFIQYFNKTYNKNEF
jgi:hypothetical protein